MELIKMTDAVEIKNRNAIIKDTVLGFEDHGILTCWLSLDYGGAAQSFGGYAFGGDYVTTSPFGMEFIRQILKTVGVQTWEELKGKHIRVKASNYRVFEIGHITENKWFNPEHTILELTTALNTTKEEPTSRLKDNLKSKKAK